MMVSFRLPMGKPGKGSVFTVRLPGSADKSVQVRFWHKADMPVVPLNVCFRV